MSVTYHLSVARGSSSTFPPESGPLRRDGKYLLDDQGRVWFGRGLTMFLLYARMLRGEDIQPQLEWCRSVGANYLRLFGPIPVPPWGEEWKAYSKPDPAILSRLGEFADQLAAKGLRLEFCPVCGPWGMSDAQALLRETYNQLGGKWNAFVEATNEPGQGGTFHLNLHTLIDGIDRKGVLSATGVAWWLDPASCQALLGIPSMTSVADLHWLDYGTGHFNDTQHNRYPRVSKAAKDWRDGDVEAGMPGNGRPTWLDEDCRVDDGESFPSLDDHVSHNAVGGIFSGAQLVHYNAGKFGLPAIPGGFEDQVIREASKVWAFIPASSQTGQYSAPHTGNFPLEWTNADSTVQHAYASIQGDIAYVVNCLPPPGWVAKPKPGWKILEVGPRPWILKMSRA